MVSTLSGVRSRVLQWEAMEHPSLLEESEQERLLALPSTLSRASGTTRLRLRPLKALPVFANYM